MKAVEPKKTWTAITDPVRAKSIMDGGKWQEQKPTWVVRDGTLWVLVDEQFQEFRKSYQGEKS